MADQKLWPRRCQCLHLGRVMESGQESRPSSESADTSIKVDLLPSGRRETVAVPKSGTIAELKMAQQPFRQRFLRLAAPDGSFAATLADGTVVTWGDRHFGGDSARVQDQFMYI